MMDEHSNGSDEGGRIPTTRSRARLNARSPDVEVSVLDVFKR